MPPSPLKRIKLLCLESSVTGVSACFGDGIHDLGNVSLAVLCSIVEIVIHCKARIKTVVLCCLRLLCIVDNEELIRTVLLCEVYAFRRKCIFYPKLCSIGVLASLEYCCCSDLAGGS